MKKHNILGFNSHLDERIDNLTIQLNESINQEIKKHSSFKSIKEIEFYLEEKVLMVKVKLRSGEVLDEVFSSHIDLGAICLVKNEILAYFGQDKYSLIESYLEDDTLAHEYLEAYEEDVFNQLEKIYLLESAPNTQNGGEFTAQDKDFFLKLKL